MTLTKLIGLVGMVFLVLSGCGKSSGLKATQPSVQKEEITAPPGVLQAPTALSGCEGLVVKVVRTSPSGPISVGVEAIFRIEASYCGNADVVFRIRGQSETFTTARNVSVVYSEAGVKHEEVTVDAVKARAAGQIVASKTERVELTVVAAGGGSTTPPSTPIDVIFDLQMTPEGSHLDNGGPAPANYTPAGAFVDCGGGVCNGNLYIWKLSAQVQPATETRQVIVQVAVTSPGAHINGGPGLPGFQLFGSVADCGWGNCYGNQNLGYRKASLASLPKGATYLKNLTTIGYGLRINNPACPAGWTNVGAVADCAFGVCSGNVSTCALYGVK